MLLLAVSVSPHASHALLDDMCTPLDDMATLVFTIITHGLTWLRLVLRTTLTKIHGIRHEKSPRSSTVGFAHFPWLRLHTGRSDAIASSKAERDQCGDDIMAIFPLAT